MVGVELDPPDPERATRSTMARDTQGAGGSDGKRLPAPELRPAGEVAAGAGVAHGATDENERLLSSQDL